MAAPSLDVLAVTWGMFALFASAVLHDPKRICTIIKSAVQMKIILFLV
jgi:hypothetical protein